MFAIICHHADESLTKTTEGLRTTRTDSHYLHCVTFSWFRPTLTCSIGRWCGAFSTFIPTPDKQNWNHNPSLFRETGLSHLHYIECTLYLLICFIIAIRFFSIFLKNLGKNTHFQRFSANSKHIWMIYFKNPNFVNLGLFYG